MGRDASAESQRSARHNVKRLASSRFNRLFRVTAVTLSSAGLLLGILPSGADTTAPARSSTFQPAAARHVTRGAGDEQVDMKGRSEIKSQAEVDIPETSAPPTRRSFMANWQRVNGAAGYRLDVSASPQFESYVNGYQDLDVGNATGRVVTGLNQSTTYYYRVRSYGAAGTSADSTVKRATTAAAGGFVINAIFDSSITSNPNAAAIEGAINRAIAFHESLFSDPVTVFILFRYSPTGPDGAPLAGIMQSDFAVYPIDWNSYINALLADARSGADSTANASLPATMLSAHIDVSSANGRAMGLNTPPATFANGSVGAGGSYDGVVTIKSTAALRFTRPPAGGYFDAQTGIEHEVDEIIGLGAHAAGGDHLRPQDLFSWSAPGARNFTTTGTRYFSINGGSTRIVGFNQDPDGDLGDWLSGPCPQTTPYVQNAFGCAGQAWDISASSPEGINLDVIGYDLPSAAPPVPNDMNGDGKPDFVLYSASTHRTAIWYLNNNVYIGGANGPTIPAGWTLVDVADFDRDGRLDYALFNPSTSQTALWYLAGVSYAGGTYGPALPPGWQLVATADFNNDRKPDYLLYNPTSYQTAIWYLSNAVRTAAAYGPTLPAGWSLAGVADFNRDGHLDYLIFNSSTRQSAIWYLLSGAAFAGAQYGPTIASSYQLIMAADFNRDGKPDYLLYNPTTQRTAIWYLNGNALTTSAFGPTLPAGWGWPSP